MVDNGSTDGSGDVARELGATVVVEPRRGFGAACAAGLAAATAPVVAFCDADGSLDPGDLPRWPPRSSRARPTSSSAPAGPPPPVPGRPTPGWPTATSPAASAGTPGGRHRPRPAAGRPPRRPRPPSGIDDRRFGWPLEMVVRAAAAGWRITEVPVAYAPRIGRSKVTGTVRGTARAVRDMRRVLAEWG